MGVCIKYMFFITTYIYMIRYVWWFTRMKVKKGVWVFIILLKSPIDSPVMSVRVPSLRVLFGKKKEVLFFYIELKHVHFAFYQNNTSVTQYSWRVTRKHFIVFLYNMQMHLFEFLHQKRRVNIQFWAKFFRVFGLTEFATPYRSSPKQTGGNLNKEYKFYSFHGVARGKSSDNRVWNNL